MVFFGEDQNDWVGLNLLAFAIWIKRVDVDTSFLQVGLKKTLLKSKPMEIVYRNVDDFTNLLSDEEQKALENNQNEFDVGLDSLSAAMQEDIGVTSVEASEEDIDELLQFLHDDAKELIAPEAYAGENQFVSSNTGSAIITLMVHNQQTLGSNRSMVVAGFVAVRSRLKQS